MAETQSWASAPSRPAKRRAPVARFRRWVGGSFTPYLYIAPFFLFFLGVFGYPLGYAFYVSLHRWSGLGAMRDVGLGNYTFVLTDDFWWSAVGTTAALWLLIVPLGTALSLLLAVAWNRRGFRGLGVSRILWLVPTVSSLVAVSAVFRILYDRDYGPINVLLGIAHIPAIPWLTSETWSKPAIAIVRLWESVGLFALFFSAALQNISQDIYDAAAVDGCAPLRQFWHMTLPLLTRTILFLTVIQTLGVLGLFIEPSLITTGGPGISTITIGLYLYHLIQGLDLGTSSAVAFLTTAMMLAIAGVMSLVARRWQFD